MADASLRPGGDYNKRLNYDELKYKVTRTKQILMLHIVRQQLLETVIRCNIYYK